MTAKPTTVSFSARELETMAFAWQCLESDPKINYAKFAALGGWTEGSAKTIMGNLKRKIKLHAESVSSGINATGSAVADATFKKHSGGRPKKRVAEDDEEAPVKKRRGKKVKAADKDDNEFANVRVKREELSSLVDDANGYFMQQGLQSKLEDGGDELAETI